MFQSLVRSAQEDPALVLIGIIVLAGIVLWGIVGAQVWIEGRRLRQQADRREDQATAEQRRARLKVLQGKLSRRAS